jgi:hypothetical protein
VLIKSQAGEFDISISRFEREGDDLVMVGAMGVWEARTHITPKDALGVVRLLLTSGAVWAFMCRLPFLLMRRTK